MSAKDEGISRTMNRRSNKNPEFEFDCVGLRALKASGAQLCVLRVLRVRPYTNAGNSTEAVSFFTTLAPVRSSYSSRMT